MLTLDTEITKINRIGVATGKRLNNIGLHNVHDLLFYFPFRYEDFRKTTPIEKLQDGMETNIVGQIELINNKKSPRKKMYITEALVSDGTEQIKVIWFNQPFIARNLRVGNKISLAGKVKDDYSGLSMVSPAYEKITSTQTLHTKRLVPDYHLTANITQKQIRFLIKEVIRLAEKQEEWLPEKIIKKNKLLSINEALHKIHFPENQKDIDEARRRLSFNELFLVQLQSQLIKQGLESQKSIKIPFLEKETKIFVDSLPFKLTDAQKKSAWQILQDLEKNKPMARLLEGDVGSGKTVVAIIAMLNTALNKMQSALMVPTEILAEQHFNSISKILKKTNIKIGLITANLKKINKNKNNNAKNIIKNSQIIIGTHALIQKNIQFNNLALAIIDEQHRFGVEQRKKLVEKSGETQTSPHFLSMTATPIPRSLALAIYGDLDISIINEMPKGRKKIITSVVPESKRQKAYDFILKQINNNKQVFVICPLIDISDKLGVKSVKEEFKKLDKLIFPDIKISMLHGRMKSKEKETVMQDFLDNKIKILVSTSVVEVGVDVPNATIMVIEGADRFGLAQLHQFRGRVGRDKDQSYCFLFTDSESRISLERLKALEQCHNGFTLAKTDLKFRGPGQVFGTMQKGFPELKMASLFDYELMKLAKKEAENLLTENKDLKKYPILNEKIKKMNKNTHLE